MRGHERLFDLRRADTVQAITIEVGSARPYESRIVFDGPARLLPRPVEIVDPEYPVVWTERTEPGPLDLRWLIDAMVFVIQTDGADDLYRRWLTAITAGQPKFVATVAEGELITWPA